MEDDESPDEKTEKSKITLPEIQNTITPRQKIMTSKTKVDASLSNNLSYENLQTANPTYDSKTADRKSHRRVQKDRYNSKSTLIGSKKSLSIAKATPIENFVSHKINVNQDPITTTLHEMDQIIRSDSIIFHQRINLIRK